MRISRIRAAVALSATAACAVAGLVATAGSAQADGSFTVFHSAGSDTIQAVEAALGDSTSVINAPSGAKATIYSYDAVTGNAVSGYQTHATAVTASGQTFVRPNGSGEGRLALAYANKNLPWPSTAQTDTNGVSLAGQIDIARSSGKPTTGASDVTAVPLARDAFGVAIIQTQAGYAANPINALTYAQIHDAYTATGTADVSGVKIVPWLPQPGSGTRGDFLGKLTDNTAGGANGQSIEPTKTASNLIPASRLHEENTLAATGSGACSSSNYFCSMLPTAADQTHDADHTAYIVPFSAAQWVAQQIGTQTDTTSISGAHTELAALSPTQSDTTTASAVQPYQLGAHAAGDKHGADDDAAYSAYYAGFWGRDVYNVVPTANVTGANATSTLATYLSKNLTSAAAQSIIMSYGFLNVPYAGELNTSDTASAAPWGGTNGSHVILGKWETDLSSGNTFGGAKFPYKVTSSSVALAGAAAAGQTLTVTGGFTSPDGAPTSYTYAWNDGAASLYNGTNNAFVVPAGEAGKTLTLTVTGTKTNFQNATQTLSVVIAANHKVTAPSKVSFTGTAKVGKTLTAAPGTWKAGSASLAVSLQWLNNGKAIKGATKSTLKLSKSLAGHKISLKVSVSVPEGYEAAAAKTSAAKKVTK
jgi:hypothetical protein